MDIKHLVKKQESRSIGSDGKDIMAVKVDLGRRGSVC